MGGACPERGRLGLGRGLTASTPPRRPSDEHHPEVKADGHVDDLAEAVDLLLQHADQ